MRAKHQIWISYFVTMIAASSLLSARAGQLRVRAMDWDPSISISSRLLDDDEMVVLTVTGDRVGFDSTSKPKDVVLFATSKSDVVVVATLESAHPLLVRNGTWIDTSIQGVVQQVLKSRGKIPVSSGKPITLEIEQGEMQIGKVLVRAGSPLAPVKGDRQYLLFLRWDAQLGALFPVLAPVLLDGNTLETMSGRPLQASPLTGLTLRDVVSIVKTAR
jgi:hypothetical protein